METVRFLCFCGHPCGEREEAKAAAAQVASARTSGRGGEPVLEEGKSIAELARDYDQAETTF